MAYFYNYLWLLFSLKISLLRRDQSWRLRLWTSLSVGPKVLKSTLDFTSPLQSYTIHLIFNFNKFARADFLTTSCELSALLLCEFILLKIPHTFKVKLCFLQISVTIISVKKSVTKASINTYRYSNYPFLTIQLADDS